MKETHNPGSSINVYWVLQTADLPDKLAFVQDRKDRKHYLLTVTEAMTVWQLIDKLKWLADRMSIIRNAERAL